jgi:hypothetical protein
MEYYNLFAPSLNLGSKGVPSPQGKKQSFKINLRGSWRLVHVTFFLLFLIATSFFHPASAQTTEKEWQSKAVLKYPALGIEGSELNKRFLEAYTQRRKAQPSFFLDPRWPVILADELNVPRLSASTPVPSTSSPRPPEAPTPKPQVNLSSSPTGSAPSESRRSAQSPIIRITPRFAIAASAGGVIGLIILVSAVKAARRRRRKANMYAEARRYVEAAQISHALPTVRTSVILKPGEFAFYSAYSVLFETRAVRHYQAGHTGFRLAKGVYIGGSRGRSTSSQEWSKIDSGILTVTNERLIFDGGGADHSVVLSKILSADSSLNGVEISVEGRGKSMIFTADNSLVLATIIRICCQASDPLDLSKTTLDITFIN